MKFFRLFSIVILSVSSCVREVVIPVCGGDETYPITVEVAEPMYMSQVRSSFTEEEFARITDLNIFVYHNGQLLKEAGGYFTDMSGLMLTFPHDRNCFNIYMVGNIGRVEPPVLEADVCNLRHVVGTYEDFRINGFPVANVFLDHMKGTLASFRLKRLVGQYDITMKPSASNAEYYVKDARLLNCALDVFPFGSGIKAGLFTDSGDCLTSGDIARLNEGEPVSLYFVENLQGELLPDNMDRTKKIPSVLNNIGAGLADCCTYIEITADITTPAARYVDAKYRFYLGQNETSDFSIVRNTLYDVMLDFSQNMVNEQEWRIEVDAPEVKPLVLSKEKANVAYGVSDHIWIEGPEVRINEDMSTENDSACCGYFLNDDVIDGKSYQKLTFYTNREIDGFYTWGTDYESAADKYRVVLETVETYNGVPLASRTVTAYVYDKVFPLFIRMNTNGNSAPYQVEVLTDSPLLSEFEIEAVADVDITVSGTTTANTYSTSSPVTGTTAEGLRCCSAAFSGLYDIVGEDDGKIVRFRQLDLTLKGKETDCSQVTGFYMGDGGKAYWGPGADLAPQRLVDLVTSEDVSLNISHFCDVAGCIRYQIKSGNNYLFIMAPKGCTCSSVQTTGTSNSLSYDMGEYSSGDYIPFYIVNGGLEYSPPVTVRDEDAKYLDDSARKSIMFEMNGPGRDVFYPNGVKWGGSSENSPDPVHKFGYTAGLTKQFFGNVRTWQIYQKYESEFYMMVNGCTNWPGSSRYAGGFTLTYSL